MGAIFSFNLVLERNLKAEWLEKKEVGFGLWYGFGDSQDEIELSKSTMENLEQNFSNGGKFLWPSTSRSASEPRAICREGGETAVMGVVRRRRAAG